MFGSVYRFCPCLPLRRTVLERRALTRTQRRWYDRTTALLLRVLIGHISGRKLSSGEIRFVCYNAGHLRQKTQLRGDQVCVL